MLACRPIFLRATRNIVIPSRRFIANRHTHSANFTRTMATENPSKRLKTDVPVIGTHK
jgi:hypothetical protein